MAYLVMLIAPSVCNYLLTKWNKEVTHYKLTWLQHSGPVQKNAVIAGAIFGTLSHVLLDSLMHHDIRPLSPFSQANPFLGLVTHDGIYRACMIASVLGVIGWFAIKQAGGSPHAGIDLAPDPSTNKASESFFTLWVGQLCFTWLGVLLFSVVPAVLVGSGIFSIGVLTIAILVGIPAAAIGPFVFKGSGMRGLRRVVVMTVVPALAIACVSQLDKQIPGNATPLVQAIESFQRDTGDYPESLEALIPKHLAGLPNVRFSVFQPVITYRVSDGKPYLAIPSTMGDMFAQYEYNFEAKEWQHQS